MNKRHDSKSGPAQPTPPDFATRTLRDLFPHWSNLLWIKGMRPMLHDMLQLELTLSESLVLRQVKYQSLTIAAMADYLAITHSAASRAADRLVRNGFVMRSENPADRRQKLLSLTEAGTALVEALEQKFNDGVELLVSSLAPEAQEQFRQLIAQMVAANCLAPEVAPPRSAAEERQAR